MAILTVARLEQKIAEAARAGFLAGLGWGIAIGLLLALALWCVLRGK